MMHSTHDVFNQPEPLVGYNLFSTNQALRDALKFNALGAQLGTADMQTHAHPPELPRSDV